MRIIVDVNIVLSALIRKGNKRDIIVKSGFDFYFPEIALLKIRKYREYALEKSGLLEGEFDQLLAVLFKYLKILPTESVRAHWKEALEIMGKVDTEDVVFIAAALSLPRSCVWSEDRHFERQNRVLILKTIDIVKLLY